MICSQFYYTAHIAFYFLPMGVKAYFPVAMLYLLVKKQIQMVIMILNNSYADQSCTGR